MTRIAILTAAALLGLNATASVAATQYEQVCFERVRVACNSTENPTACIEPGMEICQGLGDGPGANGGDPLRIKLIKFGDDTYKFRILPDLPQSSSDVDNEHRHDQEPARPTAPTTVRGS